MIADAAVGFLIGLPIGAVLAVLGQLWVAPRASERIMLPLDVRAAGDAPSSTLDRVLDAARAAALRITTQSNGFDVLSQPPAAYDRMVSVRVANSENVSWSTLMLTYDKSYALALEVLSALVPVLGPVSLVLDGNRIAIDGSLDARELTNAHAKFVRARLRAHLS